MEPGKTDLQFLLNAAQSKLPYSDPEFMDDGYLYFAPEKGASFMQNFYPVPFVAKSITESVAKPQGNYAHRPGNFVNHFIIGDFSAFYPFELFRDNSVWKAKALGEEYYYTNDPKDLPLRDDINDPPGQITIEEIGEFISASREEALMMAVSFLISQYELRAEERKFLVIRDDSEEKIEMWIAAIEHAFSPRMAATIPFATRMDKFTTANKYTVNQMGLYQTQINLQDKNQKLRYRAMIVGVDERDRVNASAAQSFKNSPFVLLDGKEKKAMFEADISNRYYKFIASFDSTHQSFCREFLQTINITKPSSDIYGLLDIYDDLCQRRSLPASEKMVETLSFFAKYELLPSKKLEKIYLSITNELPRYLQDNLYSALSIIKWLQSTAHVIGDSKATLKLTEIVCKIFTEQVFSKSNSQAMKFWQDIKNSEFALSVSRYFVDPETLEANQGYLHKIPDISKFTYVLIFLDCAAFSGKAEADCLKRVVDMGLEICFSSDDANSAHKILKALERNRAINVQNVLFSIAKQAQREYAEFIIMNLIEFDRSLISSPNSMRTFLSNLKSDRMKHLYGAVLKYQVKAISKAAEIDEMIILLDSITDLTAASQGEIYAILDQKLSMTEKRSLKLAKAISDRMPPGSACPKSAHLIALDALGDKNQRGRLTQIYSQLAPKGFPSLKNADYITSLINALFKANISSQEMEYIVKLFCSEPNYIKALVAKILAVTTSRNTEDWNLLLLIAAKEKNKNLDDALINECARLKHGQKAINQLSEMLEGKKPYDYFQSAIAPPSMEIIRSQKPQSWLFRTLFSRGDGSKKKKW
jgi:hypothetical protein